MFTRKIAIVMQKAGKPVGLLAAADPEGVEAKQFMNCFIEI